MKKQDASSPLIPSPWWVQMSEWLSRQRGFVWGDIILGVILNIFATWLISPSGSTFSNTPLGTLLAHPLIFFLVGIGLIVLLGVVKLIAYFSGRQFKVFEHQEAAYQFLMNMIDHSTIKYAVMLQYSCTTGLPILRALLRKGAKVTVFIQHEDISRRMGSQFQANRIMDTTQNLLSNLGDALVRPDRLKVYKYHVPSSISAIKIDNRVLCIGWYTYEEVDRAAEKTYTSDTFELSAHDRAAVIAVKGTHEFRALDKTFSVLEKNYRAHAEHVPI